MHQVTFVGRRLQFFSATPTVLSPNQLLRDNLSICDSRAKLEKILLKTPPALFDAPNVSLALFLMGKHRSNNSELVKKLFQQSESLHFHPKQLSQLCFGVATGQLSPNIPPFFVQQVLSMPWEDLQPNEFASLLFSFSFLNHQDKNVLAKAESSLMARQDVSTFSIRTLSLLVHSFAVLNSSCDSLFNKLTDSIVHTTDTLHGQDVFLIAKSLALLFDKNDKIHPSHHNEELLTKLLNAIMQQLPASECRPHVLATVVNVLALVEFQTCDSFCQWLANKATTDSQAFLSEFSASQLTSMLASFSTLVNPKTSEPATLLKMAEAVVRECLRRELVDFQVQDVNALLFALDALHFENDILTTHLAQEMDKREDLRVLLEPE